MEVEEMIEAGILVPPHEEESLKAYQDFTRRYKAWKQKEDLELRGKEDLE
jgi:hypothetical protein